MAPTTTAHQPTHRPADQPAHRPARRPASTAVPPATPAGAPSDLHDLPRLLDAVRSGDEEAWSALTRRYGGLLRAVSRRQGMSAPECADIAQTTWLRLFTHLDHIRNPCGLGSWLATTATRECHAQRRRHHREAPVEIRRLDGVQPGQPHEELLDRLDGIRRARMLREAVTRLPGRQRLLVELLLSEEPLSYRQIAARLDMPVGAIGPIRQRALRRLRLELESMGCGRAAA